MLYCRRQRSIKIFASVNVSKILRSSSSSRNFPLNDSTYPFSQGLPGSMNNVSTWRAASHCRINVAVNSGALSEPCPPLGLWVGFEATMWPKGDCAAEQVRDSQNRPIQTNKYRVFDLEESTCLEVRESAEDASMLADPN